MQFFWAFLVGGALCVIGQLLIDLTAMTPARILVLVRGQRGWCSRHWAGIRRWQSFAGAGATVAAARGLGICWRRGVIAAVEQHGLLGALTGGFSAAAGGIAASLACGVIASLLARSKDQC